MAHSKLRIINGSLVVPALAIVGVCVLAPGCGKTAEPPPPAVTPSDGGESGATGEGGATAGSTGDAGSVSVAGSAGSPGPGGQTGTGGGPPGGTGGGPPGGTGGGPTGGTGGGPTGGTSGGPTGGTGGSGGSAGAPYVPCGDPAIIDDMEEPDTWTCGNLGVWYINHDGSGSLTPDPGGLTGNLPGMEPIPGGRDGSTNGAMLSGTGVGDFAELWIHFQAPFNADAYTGIKFWGRTTAALLVLDIVVSCAATVSIADQHMTNRSLLSVDDWREVEVPFGDLVQTGGGTAGFERSTVQDIRFRVGDNADFEFWIDDVVFY